jgi:hypothetical protein
MNVRPMRKTRCSARCRVSVPAVVGGATPAQVPDWSDETLALFADLTALEQTWVEWYVVGVNAAEAYRRAVGFDPSGGGRDYGKQYGYEIRRRPRVKKAIEAALKDRNFDARMDREWKLMVIREQLEYARDSRDVRLAGNIPRLLKLAAELQGELPWRPEPPAAQLQARAGVRQRIEEILADAQRFIAGRPPADRPQAHLSAISAGEPDHSAPADGRSDCGASAATRPGDTIIKVNGESTLRPGHPALAGSLGSIPATE